MYSTSNQHLPHIIFKIKIPFFSHIPLSAQKSLFSVFRSIPDRQHAKRDEVSLRCVEICWENYLAAVGTMEKRNANRCPAEKPKRKWPLAKPKHRWGYY